MRKFFSLVLALMLLFTVSAYAEALPEETLFTSGTYEATAKGFGGDVTVTITVSDNEITEVNIKGDAEAPALGGVAVETMAPAS